MTQIHQGGPAAGQPKSLFPTGRVLEIGFPTFTPRITFRSERELTVEIVAAKASALPIPSNMKLSPFATGSPSSRGGSTSEARSYTCSISISGQAYTAVTPAKGGFWRLTGRIEIKS
jgi:hypothetical protein